MPGFGSKQPLQQQSLSSWFIVSCGVGVLLNVIVYSVIWHVVWWFCGGPINYFSFVKRLFFTPPGKPAVLLNSRL